MATTLTVTQTGPREYLATWSTDVPGATVYVYRNGELWLSSATQTTQTFVVEPGEHILLEALDDAATEPAGAYGGRARIEWMGATGVGYYSVEEYVSGTWQERARISNRVGQQLVYRTPVLTDGSTAQWRVTGYDAAGVGGTPAAYTFAVVRWPDIPEVAGTYDSGTGDITIVCS